MCKRVKYNKKYFYLFIPFFSLIRLQVRPVHGFLRAIAQKTWNHARMCLFGVIKLKFNFKPLFIPQNRQILAQNGTVFRPKMLNNGALKCKLPLIITTYVDLLSPLSPKSPNFALQIAVFSSKHTVLIVIDAHCAKFFYTTWVRGVSLSL